MVQTGTLTLLMFTSFRNQEDTDGPNRNAYLTDVYFLQESRGH